MTTGSSFFDKADIEKAIDAYNKVQIDPVQRKILETFGAIAHQHIPIEEIALRGFGLMGIKNWQTEHQKYAKDIAMWSTADKIIAIKEMAAAVEKSMVKILKKADDAGKLKKAMKMFVDHYSNTFAQR